MVLVVAASLTAARTDYISAKKKFQAIENSTSKSANRISFSSEEINAYVQTELPEVAPKGIRDPHVVLNGNNKATGSAQVDFIRLRSAQGRTSNWLLRKLLEGEHEVKVTTRISSGKGQATVDIEEVQVGGLPISGAALDFLINNYLKPNYPEAKIGRPFRLHSKVERIEVKPGVAHVLLKQ